MNHYIGACDLLITDYSGALFDAAICDKKIVLYVPDLKNYETNERGFYLDYNKIPYPKAFNEKELYQILGDNNYDYKLFNRTINDFVGNIDTGFASSSVTKDILSWMKKYG
jgi:CDP-glycerol glycerophosphotransferase (TagB/SpsB family)